MANPRVVGTAAQTVHRGVGGSSLRVPSATFQLVTRGAFGLSSRVSHATAQTVRRGTQGATGRAPFVAVQVVSADLAERTRQAFTALQVVHRGDSGAMARQSFATVQVVFTTGAAESSRQRAWTFDFDGHTFYVLDLGAAGSLVYDLTTGQWSRFVTAGYGGHWDMKNGFHWRTGKMVVAGQAGTGTIHYMDSDSFFDEGWRPVDYEVRGVLPVSGTDYHRQYALRLVGSAGQTADDVAPVLRMQFSDDNGVTWSEEHALPLKQDTRQRIEFRSLGAFTAPGRIFRIYDSGGIKFIAYVEADVGGEDGRTPA